MREEMHTIANLVLLAEVDLGAEFARQVHVGDSSDLGFALLYTKASSAECRSSAGRRDGGSMKSRVWPLRLWCDFATLPFL